MTTYIKVNSTLELHNKVDELVGDLPVAWSSSIKYPYPYAEVTHETCYKRGLRKSKVKLVKNIYDESKIEKYEIAVSINYKAI